MKYGARNQIVGKVASIKKGAIMGQVAGEVKDPCTLTSVLTLDSIQDLGLREGDRVRVAVKAIQVLLAKE